MTGNPEVMPEVINGYLDTKNNFDYVVCIEQKNENSYLRFCTGSLIDEKWILTAGHCTGNKTLSVSYGNRSQENFVDRVNVILQIRHPDYKQFESQDDHGKSEIRNDIGLLKVETIPINPLGMISFVDYTPFTGLTVVYAGYGITWREHVISSSENWEKFLNLKSTPLQLASGVTVKCNISITWHPSTCVHSEESFSGMGDSGGPLIYDETVVGVHSGYYGEILVFVPVQPYLKWIHQVIAQYE